MIHQIQIKGFKSIENVAFEPGRVNVLIGANGSGKSNLLEAIGMLSAAVSGRVDDESLRIVVSVPACRPFINVPFWAPKTPQIYILVHG